MAIVGATALCISWLLFIKILENLVAAINMIQAVVPILDILPHHLVWLLEDIVVTIQVIAVVLQGIF